MRHEKSWQCHGPDIGRTWFMGNAPFGNAPFRNGRHVAKVGT